MEKEVLTGYPSVDKPWLKYYSEEVIKAELPRKTIYEYIYDNNQDNLDKVALNYYGSNITYRQMFCEISYIAGTLEQEGIKEGDIVTVCMVNSPETIFLVFALNKIGAIANMVYGGSPSGELKQNITDCKSTIVFTLDIFLQKIVEISEDIAIEKIVVANIAKSMSLLNKFAARMFKGMKPPSLPDSPKVISWEKYFSKKILSKKTCHKSDIPAFITYTGGTTGGSKGAILSNKAVLAVVHQDILCDPDMQRGHTWMQILPLFIAYGVTCSLTIPLAVGMTLIIRIPMTESIAEVCKKFKPNHIVFGPAYWEAFANDNKHIDLSHLIAPVSGGDILSEKAETKINKYFQKNHCPSRIINGYGMTEVGAVASVNFQYLHKPESVGIPLVKNIISAFDVETGEELKYGEQGEICIQGPSMMMGYVNNSEETANIVKKHDDGHLWIHSGDLGYVTEDGFVYICGRLKRYMMHIANGIHKKIFSLDIEKVLLKCQEVENCVVVPIESKEFFQVPVAFLILKKGSVSETAKKKIKRFAERNLEPSYCPVKYYFVEKFPLTKVGKVDYRALEQMAQKNAGEA